MGGGNLGGIFKYYSLESYEQILDTTKYEPTPKDYLDSKKNINEIKDCFLFDKKLSEVIEEREGNFYVNENKLYNGRVDLKESIYNITGYEVEKIENNEVIFKNKKVYKDGKVNLLMILKPFLFWGGNE